MEQIEETQAAFKEDLNQVKGDVSSMKGDMSQVLLALKNIIDRQDQIPRVAFEEVAQTISASSGHQLRKEPEVGPLNPKRPVSDPPKRQEGEINVVASQARIPRPLVIPQGQQQGRRPPIKFDPLPMPPS